MGQQGDTRSELLAIRRYTHFSVGSQLRDPLLEAGWNPWEQTLRRRGHSTCRREKRDLLWTSGFLGLVQMEL